MSVKEVVIFGVLGTDKDRLKKTDDKTKEWRPTVDICRQEDLPVSRYELFYQKEFKSLAESIASDVEELSDTKVLLNELNFNGDPWDFETVYGEFYDFAKKYKFNHEKERYLVNISTGTHVMQICLFLLTEARYFPGKLVQSPRRKGRTNTPSSCKEIDLRLNKYDKIFQRFRKEEQDDISILKNNVETKNPIFEALIKKILFVASNFNYPVLLTGQTGVGKSTLAKQIHELRVKKQKADPIIVSVNCATLRGDLLKSELFGHSRGAFTGATKDHRGFLESANGGTLFLDEIGELDLEAQKMLLIALEEKKFSRTGDHKIIESDFYLITGTNCDLREKVSQQLFRQDLLARIEIYPFEIPSLKDRPEDIEPHLKSALEKFSQENNKNITINDQALTRYLEFATSLEAVWCNNLRDLISSTIRMASFSDSNTSDNIRITESVVSNEIIQLKNKWRGFSSKQFPLLEKIVGKAEMDLIDCFYHPQIEEVIKVCLKSKNRSEASRKLYNVSLGKKSSKNDADRLIKFLKIFNLDWDTIKNTFKKL